MAKKPNFKEGHVCNRGYSSKFGAAGKAEKKFVEMSFIERLKESILMTTEIPGLMMSWTEIILHFFYDFVCLFKGLIKFLGLGAAGLRHIGPSASASADYGRDLLDNASCVKTIC